MLCSTNTPEPAATAASSTSVSPSITLPLFGVLLRGASFFIIFFPFPVCGLPSILRAENHSSTTWEMGTAPADWLGPVRQAGWWKVSSCTTAARVSRLCNPSPELRVGSSLPYGLKVSNTGSYTRDWPFDSSFGTANLAHTSNLEGCPSSLRPADSAWSALDGLGSV